ncbi:hypothetical protein, partial [Escherichia coli]|uniref:hypothetical protein n=1 Tax=Escherichia coli TaxID=562 RepID=UPI003EDE9ED5
ETRYDVLLSEMLYILIRGDSLMPSGITLDNAYPAMIRYIYGTRLFSLCSFSDFIFRKCSPA